MGDSDKRRLLLIDDSPTSLHFAERVLEREGYEVRSTTRLDDLDQVLASWAPHVILTDVSMPGVSGVELCQLLKARYETAHVPVVLFSSLPDSELEQLARRCAADGYLCKVNGLPRLAEELELLCSSLLW